MRRVVLLMSALAMISGLIGIRTHAAFQVCAGNACSSVQVTFVSPCYNVRNTGSKPIKVEFHPLGPASSMSRVLGPGENWQPIQPFTTQCMGGFIEPYIANFAGQDEITFGPAILPNDSKKPLNATILWNTAPTQQMGPGIGVLAIRRNHEGLMSTIVFHNLFHQPVTVELRAGNFLDCNLNRSLPSIIIGPGEQHSLSTDESICFRRDLDPDHPTGQLTPFTTINIDPPPSSPQHIEINI